MYKIVIFDMDGTLLNARRQIPQSAVDAINTLQNKGIITVVASARTPYNIHNLLEQLRIESYIVYNGGLIIHDNKILHQEILDKGIVESFILRVRENHHSALVEGAESFSLVSNDGSAIIEKYIEHWDFTKLIPYEEMTGAISQMDLFCLDRELETYVRNYPQLTFYPWMTRPNAFNVIPQGVSKAYGIKMLLEKLDIPVGDAAAFGDGPNDIEMLSSVGTGVAMGNAVPELKAVANSITSNIDDDGIAKGLKNLGLI